MVNAEPSSGGTSQPVRRCSSNRSVEPGDGGRDAGKTGRHRFEKGNRHPFTNRRHDVDVAGAEVAASISASTPRTTPILPTPSAATLVRIERARTASTSPCAGSVRPTRSTPDPFRTGAGSAAPRVEQTIRAFVAPEKADKQNQASIARKTESPANRVAFTGPGRPEAIDIDGVAHLTEPV